MNWSKEDVTVVQRYLEDALDVASGESRKAARELVEFLAEEGLVSNEDDLEIAREEGYEGGYSDGYDQGYGEGYESGKEDEDD